MNLRLGDDLRTAEVVDSGDYERFLPLMDELGLLADLENDLPPGFSAVFEIGRLLADPASEIGRKLAPALRLVETAGEEPIVEDAPTEVHRVEVPAGEEYEAEFIRSWSDVQYVYAWQHLLPEEEFLRRLAKRTLWFPMAKAPLIRGIETGQDDFNPSPTKQKVYVLLDTSSSMQLRFRFAYAKAIVLHFLRRNRREMGEVFLRTFDVALGPLHTARDASGYDLLLRKLARQSLLGNGTALEKAIVQATKDIRERRGLAGAEILVVTDGAARLREDRVEQALGQDIRLHCVKIGGAQVYATEAYIEERLDFRSSTHTRLDQRILQARDQKEKLEESLKHESQQDLRGAIQRALAQIEKDRGALGDEVRKGYGHEIERLAHVYVEVPDLDPATLFRLDPERLEQLRALARAVTQELEETPTRPETLKQAALLLTHLKMLSDEQIDEELREHLDRLHQHLEQRTEDSLHEHERRMLDAQLLTQADQRDLRILMRRGTQRHSSIWTLLLRLFYATVSRWAGSRGKR